MFPFFDYTSAFHDIISDTVTQCSRLIIVLSQSSADSQSEEGPSLHADQGQLSYEQKIGIHDALTRNEPQVILVEIGEGFTQRV